MSKVGMLRENKFAVVAISWIALVPCYFHIMKINPFFNDINILQTQLYLVFFLSLLYLMYLVGSAGEFILIRIMKVVQVKYFLLYPFCYDGKWSFKPLKMFTNYECLNDGCIFNLIDDIKNNTLEAEMYGKYQKIIRARTLCFLVSGGLVFFSLSCYLSASFLYDYLFIFTGYVLLSYCSYGASWKGSRYILSKNLLKIYIYSLPNLREFTSEDYGEYLIGMMKKNALCDYECVDILENYLYACVMEDAVYLNDETMKKIYTEVFQDRAFMKFHSVKSNAQKNHQMKMMGILSKYIESNPYADIFEEEMYKYFIELTQVNFFYDLREKLKAFKRFVEGEDVVINYKRQLVVGVRDYMSYRAKIERKLIWWINSSMGV